VVQYRDRILQLTPLASVLGEGDCGSSEAADLTQVIVFAEGDRMAGLIVDQIMDIHDESIRVGASSKQPRLSGSAVLGGRVTDFLDLPAVLRATDSSWVTDTSRNHPHLTPVLVADPSAFSRGLVRNYLELAGYEVVEAVDVSEALQKLDHNSVGAVITAFGSSAAARLVQEMRLRPALSATPVVNLSDQPRTSLEGGFQACVDRFDREALLSSLQNLAQAVQSDAGRPEMATSGR
jgi:two-component system chemotaxis sensor kinase CheA